MSIWSETSVSHIVKLLLELLDPGRHWAHHIVVKGLLETLKSFDRSMADNVAGPYYFSSASIMLYLCSEIRLLTGMLGIRHAPGPRPPMGRNWMEPTTQRGSSVPFGR